jgi:hypothetical protein
LPVFTFHTIAFGEVIAGAQAHLVPVTASFSMVAVGSASSSANPFFWYVTRAAAVSSYIVLTAVVLLGISRSLVRIAGARASWVLDEIHQFLAAMVAGRHPNHGSPFAATKAVGR